MIYLRTSTIESYRRVMEEEYASEDELAAYVKAGQDGEANWKMDAGTAWHHHLAGTGHLAGDRFEFDPEVAAVARAYVGHGITELTGYKTFNVRGVQVQLEGTADHVWGRAIQDHKTKFSPANPDDYEPSLQWRSYLLIHDCDVFRYHLWSFRDPKGVKGADPEDGGFCEFKDVTSFRFWRYPGMEDEVTQRIADFISWAEGMNLLRFVSQPRRRAPTRSKPRTPAVDPRDECEACKRPAAVMYQDHPSCGRVKCELSIQAYLDYQEGVGNR